MYGKLKYSKKELLEKLDDPNYMDLAINKLSTSLADKFVDSPDFENYTLIGDRKMRGDKSEKIKELLSQDPNITNKEVIEKVKCSSQSVFNVRKKLGITSTQKYSHKRIDVTVSDMEVINHPIQKQIIVGKQVDLINHPPHYKSNGMEVIDIIEGFNLNFRLGNCIKYILRAGKKDEKYLQDLKKAKWYLEKEISKLIELETKNE